MLPSLLLSCEVLAGRKEPVPFPSLEGTPEHGPDGPSKWIDLTVLSGREERLSNGQVLRLPSHHLPLLGSHRQLKPNLPSPVHTLPTPDLQHSCLWDWCWLLVIAPAETKDSSFSLILQVQFITNSYLCYLLGFSQICIAFSTTSSLSYTSPLNPGLPIPK